MKRFMPTLAAIAVLGAPLATTATAVAGQDAAATPNAPVETVEPFALVGGDYGSQGYHHGLPETSLVPSTEPVASDELPD